MKLIDIARLGNDPELRHTQGGTPVAGLSLAFTYGQKGQDGKRPTQWIDAALFGKQAESLMPYLIKGTPWLVTLDDVHLEEFQRRDGSMASKMVAKVVGIEFVPGADYGNSQQGQQQAPRQQQPADNGQAYRNASGGGRARPAPAPQGGHGGGDDFDEIPFAQRHYLEG